MNSRLQQTQIGGPCWICGCDFLTSRSHQKTCTPAHRQVLFRRGGVATSQGAIAIAKAKTKKTVTEPLERSGLTGHKRTASNPAKAKKGRAIGQVKARSRG